MSDFYSGIAEQNSEIKAALSEEAERQGIVCSIDKGAKWGRTSSTS